MAKMPAWITRDERPTCGEADAPIWRGRKAGRLKVLPIGLGADVLSPLTVHEGRRWFGCIVYILYSIGYVEYTLHHWFGRGGLEMRVHIVTSSWLIRCRDRAKGVYIYIQSTTTDHGSSLYTHQTETVYLEGHYNVTRRQSMAYANHPMSPVASSKGNGHTRAYRRAELYTLRPQLAWIWMVGITPELHHGRDGRSCFNWDCVSLEVIRVDYIYTSNMTLRLEDNER